MSDAIDGGDFDLPPVTKDEAAYRALREWIWTGELEPGERLDQVALAQRLGVSRMPLRTALSRLAAEGLITPRPHRSPVVSRLSNEEVQDIFAARAALEPIVGRRAAQRCSEDVLDAMAGVIEAQVVAVEAADTRGFVRLDRVFHQTLYAASGWVRTVQIIESLRDSSDRYTHLYASKRERARASIDDHREILAACAQRDGFQVGLLLSRHTLNAIGPDELVRHE